MICLFVFYLNFFCYFVKGIGCPTLIFLINIGFYLKAFNYFIYLLTGVKEAVSNSFVFFQKYILY